MSITLFSGLPRSGKSYKMVAEAWKLRHKYFIIHNIVGFKTEVLGEYGWDWTKYISENNIEADVFFSKEYQQELSAKINEKFQRPMLVIIDEAHEWFDTHKKAIKMWLSYHGHLNQQIYLVAHASTNIPKVYRTFVEVEYRAKSSSFLFLPGYFFYNRLLGGVGAGYILEKKDQKIFDLYKSSDIKEDRKRKSLMLPLVLAAIVGGFILFIYSPNLIFHSKDKEKKAGVEVSEQGKKVQPAANQAVQIVEKSEDFDKQYAFAGNFNGNPVFEERKSGKQYILERIDLKYKYIKSDRDNNCEIFDGKKILTVYNSDRFAGRTAHADESDGRGIIGALPGVRQQSTRGEASPIAPEM